MDIIISIIAFLVMFSVIVIIHELGHFWMAKRAGIEVEEFGLGFPPRIWGKKFKGTLYSINWIPFGGFVRLFGEDSSDQKLLKSKKSFASKTLRQRIAVTIGGVVMNFILAILLLTIGFSVGIQPLITSLDEAFVAIDDGVIEIDNGAIVKEVEEGSLAYNAGLRDGDRIHGINGETVLNPYLQLTLFDKKPNGEDIAIEVYRNGEFINYNLVVNGDLKEYGIEMYQVELLPRIVIREVEEGTASATAGLLSGDVIVSMNDKQIFSVSDYQRMINTEDFIEYNVVRGYEQLTFGVEFSGNRKVMVSGIVDGSAAKAAGILNNDIILSINGEAVLTPQGAIEINGKNALKETTYLIDRNGEETEIKVTPNEDGKIGAGILSLVSHQNNQLSYYVANKMTAITKVNDVSYPVHIAFAQSFSESGKLALITVDMAKNLVKSVVSKLTVPEQVGGVVAIAQMTHTSVQQGLLSYLRLAALLSLTLAVLNILPFPALDGGRLFFLLVEAVVGKRIPAVWESRINITGFFLLIALIIVVTYSDIVRLFS